MAGFTYCAYVSDTDGAGTFGRATDDYYLDQQTGGSAEHVSILGAVPTNGLVGMPQGLRPRHVLGLAADGTRGKAVVYTLDAPLWVGHDANTPPVAVNTWTGKSKSGATLTYTVTGFVGEQRTLRNNPA